jgi:hypothetical protein
LFAPMVETARPTLTKKNSMAKPQPLQDRAVRIEPLEAPAAARGKGRVCVRVHVCVYAYACVCV